MKIANGKIKNFMRYVGEYQFNYDDFINLIYGYNESGKSILAFDTLNYLFNKRTRFSKINNVLPVSKPNSSGYVMFEFFDNENKYFLKRFLNDDKYKNNLYFYIVTHDFENKPIKVEDFANLKINNKDIFESIGIELRYFSSFCYFNPSKNIFNDKNEIFEIFSIKFDNIFPLLKFIENSFSQSIMVLRSAINNIEAKIKDKMNLLNGANFSEIENEINENNELIMSLENKKKEIHSKIEILNEERGKHVNNISVVKGEIDKLKMFYKTGICYTCKRPFNEDKSIILKRINEFNSICNKIKNEIFLLEDKINKLKSDLFKLDNEIKDIRTINSDKQKILLSSQGEISSLKNLLDEKTAQLNEIDLGYLRFKKLFDVIINKDNLNDFIESKIKEFEDLYNDVYNIFYPDSGSVVKLNLMKYDELLIDDMYFSGLSTSKKRMMYFIFILTLKIFIKGNLDFIVLDEFFDVFDFNRTVKILETINYNSIFNKFQYIITSNSENFFNFVKSINASIINLYTL